MKGTQLRSILKVNPRYRYDVNPLRAVLNFGLAKSLSEDTQLLNEVNSIIDEELQEDFSIGGHPDYNYLLDSITTADGFMEDSVRLADVKLCSLFIDLRNFTKRALFIEDPAIETIHEIADIKQKAISTWIKIARYYQAHIHSITGDGIMVLIGGEGEEDKDEWVIGARSLLIALRVLESADILNDELKEVLVSKGIHHPSHPDNVLDIKVGIEYSPNTLMNPQGVVVNNGFTNKPVGEVKATSFEVDFSAKVLSYYKDAKEKIEDSPKIGRLLLLGEKYIDLMAFSNSVEYKKIGSYERQMFNKKICRYIYFIDCIGYKNKIITLEDVMSLCDVYDSSEVAKMSSINIAAKGDKIQHG